MADDSVLTEKYSARYWSQQLSESEDRQKKFTDWAKESIKVYKAQHDLADTQRRLNVWWYCVNTLLPAYYSSTPKAQVRLRKRSGSLVPEAGAVILERNVQFALDEYFDFDLVGYNSALQFLLTGRAILWARYEAEFEKETTEIALLRMPDGSIVDQNGAPFDTEQDGIELSEDATGLVIAKVTIEKKEDEKAILDIIQYDDFFTSDARNESEIEWVARRAYLSREAANDLFGKDVAKDLSYTSFPSAVRDDWRRDHSSYEGKAEVYEIWCKTSERVYWLQRNGDKSIIQEGEPPVEFEGFFPCSMINQSIDPDSVIPVSDYVHCKDQIIEIERLTTRIASTTQAIRTNAIYDATMGQQVEQLLQGDLKFIPVMNWPTFKGRGGSANGVEFLDVGPFVNALQVLQGARQAALQQLFETLKVSDLLRGASDATKTATANRLESAWSSLGLIVRQNQFAKFISDSINKLGTIIAEQFSPNVIFDVADADTLLLPMIPEPPPSEDPAAPAPDKMQMVEAIKAQIYDLFTDDEQRVYRIEIASDSMVALDQQQDKAEGLELIQSVGAFFEQMKGMIEQYPPLAGFAMTLLQNVTRRYKGGGELDGVFQNALGTVLQIAQAREQAASQAPAEDPTMKQIEAQLQIAQLDAQSRQNTAMLEMQLKQQLAQLDAQTKQTVASYDAEMKQLEMQNRATFEQQKLYLHQQELQLKNSALEVEVMKIQATTQTDLSKQEITKEHNRMQSILDLQRLELERVATKLAETEKLLEERRLSNQNELEQIRLSLQTAQAMPQLKEQQPIVINNIIPKASKKVGTIGTDALGNTTLNIDSIEE